MFLEFHACLRQDNSTCCEVTDTYISIFFVYLIAAKQDKESVGLSCPGPALSRAHYPQVQCSLIALIEMY